MLGDCACLLAPVEDRTALLTAAEALIIANAGLSRKRAFSSGRWLAHRALDMIGASTRDVLTGEGGQPLWPESIVGSIAHTDAHALVAVAPIAQYRGIGVDVEGAGQVTSHLGELLITSREQLLHADRDLTLIFSAKEACYKLLYPTVETYVDFREVEIDDVDEAAGTFRARYIASYGAAGILDQSEGRFVGIDDVWITCVTLPAEEIV